MRRTRLIGVKIGMACLAAFCGLTFAGAAEIADVIYHNGSILTIDDIHPRAEAVAVKDGKILSVGKKDEVFKAKGDATKLVDLDGRTMLPGFVDAHGHVMGGGLQALSANIMAPPDGDVKDISSLQTVLRAWIAKNEAAVKKIGLVVGFGYDNAQLAEQRHPTRDDLDAVSTEVPIILIHQSGHLIAVNSKGLEVGAITAKTPNPAGGVIQRGEDAKEPNGVLEETAAFPLLIKLLGRVGEGSAAFYSCRSRVVGALWLYHGPGWADDAWGVEGP